MATISFKQVKALMNITGMPEASVRAYFPSHEAASPVIGAAKLGKAVACLNACEAAGLQVDVMPAGLNDRVQEYCTKQGRALPARGLPLDDAAPVAPEPTPGPQDAAEPLPGSFSEYCAPFVNNLVSAGLGILSPAFVQGMRDTLGNIVQTGQAMLDAAQSAPAAAPGAPTLPPPAAGYYRPGWFSSLATCAAAGLDVILSGPAGTGKSRAARELAADMGRDSHVFACRAGMTRADLFYSRTISDGSTGYELAPFLTAIQSPSVVCLDEVFSLDPEVLLGLNGLLESGQRSIDTPLGTIERHPENVLVLTANIAGRSESRIYKGAQSQDASLLSRCVSVRTAYEPEVETQIAQAQIPGKRDAGWVVGIVTSLREALSRAQIAHDVTPRVYSQIGALLRQGMDKGEAARMVLSGPLEASEWAKVASSLAL